MGRKNLDVALSTFGGPDVKITWQPFFLNRDTPPEGEDLMQHLTRKYGAEAVERYGKPGNPLDIAGSKVGINFNSTRRVIRTVSCHRVMEWVRGNPTTSERQDAVMDVLFKGYFEDAKDLSNTEVLLALLSTIPNFDVDAVRGMLLETEDHKAEVFAQDDKFKRGGVSGVPFFIIGEGNRKVQFSGAQPPETFVGVFEDFLEEE